jgi:Plants and Prokaryotes Conserved (PCC) domain
MNEGNGHAPSLRVPCVAIEVAREDGEIVSHARTAEYAVEHNSIHGANRLVYAVAMTPPLEPLRLSPGADLRAALQAALAERGVQAACVVTGIRSLRPARLRLAGVQDAFVIEGDSEILTLAGTLSPDGRICT